MLHKHQKMNIIKLELFLARLNFFGPVLWGGESVLVLIYQFSLSPSHHFSGDGGRGVLTPLQRIQSVYFKPYQQVCFTLLHHLMLYDKN